MYPFDRAAIAAILLLLVLLSALAGMGRTVAPRSAIFSWRDRQISARDRFFTLAFAQPMVTSSVEANLEISPDLPGKISWRDRSKLYYTLLQPPQYGTSYQLRLQDARWVFGEGGQPGGRIPRFQAQFRARDRVFAYLGVSGDERDRIVLYNLTRDRKTVLTPPDLLAVDFEPYPDGRRILFSAVARDALQRDPRPVQLYTVTTGLNSPPSAPRATPGRIAQVLEADSYLNRQFDLSPDGKRILVERSNRLDAQDTVLWLLSDGSKARSLGIPGVAFAIAPDSQSVAVVQETGISLIPLTPQARTLTFLPDYSAIVGSDRDTGTQLFLQTHSDGTRSLVALNAEGSSRELLRTQGLIGNCQFSPQQQNTLYCLRIGGEQQLQEQPVLSMVDVQRQQETPFLALANDREVVLSMAPDGSGLLFDQVTRTSPAPRNDEVKANIWYLPLPEFRLNQEPLVRPPEKLTSGFNPSWIP
ncbi:MAG: hypothetical protein SW833_19020 [Cyanobacteriota bacterium]|nr:hypothetical protein [Cyanobacteriota bacterium]